MPTNSVALLGEDAKNHPSPDADIVEKVRAGETALFEVLMRRHNQRIYRTVRAILKDESEVEDVMQQAYVAAYGHLEQFAGTAKFSTWLVKIAVNEAFACLRRRKRFAEAGSVSQNTRRAGKTVGSFSTRGPGRKMFLARELASILSSAIDSLPHTYRIVLHVERS